MVWKQHIWSECCGSSAVWVWRGLLAGMGPCLGHSWQGGLTRKLFFSPKPKHTQEGAKDSVDTGVSGTFSLGLSPSASPSLLATDGVEDGGWRMGVRWGSREEEKS